MPISHKHMALYIHIPRTSGTFIERYLQMHTGWEKPNLDVLFGRYVTEEHEFMLQHLTCVEILENGFLDKETFNSAYKFSMVRDPFDRGLSLYHYWGGPEKWGSFEGFLKHLQSLDLENMDPAIEHRDERYHLIPQHKYLYGKNGESLVDYICRFETRKPDFAKVLKHINFVPEREDLSQKPGGPLRHLALRYYYAYVFRNPLYQSMVGLLKRRARKKKLLADEELDNPTTRALVRAIYARDYELLGYV